MLHKTVSEERETREERRQRIYRERVRNNICTRCGEFPASASKDGKKLKTCEACHVYEHEKRMALKRKVRQAMVIQPVQPQPEPDFVESQEPETPQIQLATTVEGALSDWLDAVISAVSSEEMRIKREHYERISRQSLTR
jgi:hypothetical protein